MILVSLIFLDLLVIIHSTKPPRYNDWMELQNFPNYNRWSNIYRYVFTRSRQSQTSATLSNIYEMNRLEKEGIFPSNMPIDFYNYQLNDTRSRFVKYTDLGVQMTKNLGLITKTLTPSGNLQRMVVADRNGCHPRELESLIKVRTLVSEFSVSKVMRFFIEKQIDICSNLYHNAILANIGLLGFRTLKNVSYIADFFDRAAITDYPESKYDNSSESRNHFLLAITAYIAGLNNPSVDELQNMDQMDAEPILAEIFENEITNLMMNFCSINKNIIVKLKQFKRFAALFPMTRAHRNLDQLINLIDFTCIIAEIPFNSISHKDVGQILYYLGLLETQDKRYHHSMLVYLDRVHRMSKYEILEPRHPTTRGET